MRLNHVTLIVSDYERSLAFYRSLGLRAIVLAPPRYARMIMPEGDSTLSIEVTGDAPGPSRIEICFDCPDLDGTVARLAAQGLKFTQMPTDMDYLWREAWLLDPDGHRLCLYNAGGNRLNPPWRVADPQ